MTGYKVVELVELCELPRLPSELVGMAEAGYSRKVCLAFDRAALSYFKAYRRMLEKTKQVALNPEERMRSKKVKPTKTVAFYDDEEIFSFLGINEEDDPQAVAEVLAQVTQEMWDSVEWDDEEELE